MGGGEEKGQARLKQPPSPACEGQTGLGYLGARRGDAPQSSASSLPSLRDSEGPSCPLVLRCDSTPNPDGPPKR